MLPVLLPISALLLSNALLIVGHGLMLTLLPMASFDLGFSDWQVAITGSAYFLGFVSGCLATPYMIRRVGHIRSFAVLASIYSALVLMFSWLPYFMAWLLLRFIIGIVISGLYMVIESWLNERTDASNRGAILSVYTMLNMLMVITGQQLLNFGGGNTVLLYGVAAIFISLAIIPVGLTRTLAPAPLQNVKLSLPKVWRQSHIGLIGAVVAGLVTGAFWSLAPVFARQSGFDNFQLATFMSVTVLGGACFQLPLGRLSDRYDRRIVLFFGALAGAVVSLLIVLASYTPYFLGVLATVLTFFWGGACMTLYAICLAHANDNASAADFVEIGSGMLVTLGVSSAIGAPLASLIMRFTNASGLYAYMALSLFVFAIIIVLRRRSHVLPVVAESNESFQAVSEMVSPMAYAIDPRNDDNTERSSP